LTGTSLGNATGTVGVEVSVGGGVSVGSGVCVGVSVEGACVSVGVNGGSVGVAVAAPEGRLQASIAKIRISIGIKVRDFIALSFISTIILYRCPEADNSSLRV
jgi:hypothetical protein